MLRVLFAFVLVTGFGLTREVPPAAAHGTCKVLAFEVNDYGKKGPTKDALELLDKYIVSWAKENKIKHYRRASKKNVECHLFLDFGFFDEWTCRASQTICH